MVTVKGSLSTKSTETDTET